MAKVPRGSTTADAIGNSASLEAASEHIDWTRSHQSLGFFLLRIMKSDRSGKLLPHDELFIRNDAQNFRKRVHKWLKPYIGTEVTVLYGVSSFSEKMAKAEFALPSELVHVDFDEGAELPANIPAPSRTVASSKGGRHYFWTLDKELPADERQAIAKYIAYESGADRGGHSPAKLFRLPGFHNHKYDLPYLVSVQEDTSQEHDAEALFEAAQRKVRTTPSRKSPGLKKRRRTIDPDAVVEKYQKLLKSYTLLRISQREVCVAFTFRIGGQEFHYPGDNRSGIYFGIAKELRTAGATEDEVAAVVTDTVFWRSREVDGKAEDIDRFIDNILEEEDNDEHQEYEGQVDVGFLDPSEWAEKPVPVREWVIQDWLPKLKTTGLFGDGGTGKTTVTTQLAVAAATGNSFLGLNVQAERVAMFLGENDEIDTHIQLDKICQHYGVTLANLEGRLLIASRSGLDNVLMEFVHSKGKSTKLFDALLQQLKEFDADLIIMETAADLFGGNENSRTEVRQFTVTNCEQIAKVCNASVVLCAHPSVAGMQSGEGTSGSTAWNNSVRSRLYLRREIEDGHEPNPNLRILERRKTNFSKAGEQLEIYWRDGVFVTAQNTGARNGTDELERWITDEVETAFARHNPWSPHHQNKHHYIIPHIKKQRNVTDTKAKNALNALLQRGEIVEIEYDAHNHKNGLATGEQAAKQQRNKNAK